MHGRYTRTRNCIRHDTAFLLVAVALLEGCRQVRHAARLLRWLVCIYMYYVVSVSDYPGTRVPGPLKN